MVPDNTVFQKKLASFPVETYEPGDTVLGAYSTTGRLLILKQGTVAIIKDGIEITKVAEPGAVFGELSVLLDQPHSADVRAVVKSEFHVADARALLTQDPIAIFYVATVLARRLNSANQTLVDLRRQIKAGASRAEIHKTVEKLEEQLGADSACLIYAGYPYDPFVTKAAD